jgi:hypothetical protein
MLIHFSILNSTDTGFKHHYLALVVAAVLDLSAKEIKP